MKSHEYNSRTIQDFTPDEQKMLNSVKGFLQIMQEKHDIKPSELFISMKHGELIVIHDNGTTIIKKELENISYA